MTPSASPRSICKKLEKRVLLALTVLPHLDRVVADDYEFPIGDTVQPWTLQVDLTEDGWLTKSVFLQACLDLSSAIRAAKHRRYVVPQVPLACESVKSFTKRPPVAAALIRYFDSGTGVFRAVLRAQGL